MIILIGRLTCARRFPSGSERTSDMLLDANCSTAPPLPLSKAIASKGNHYRQESQSPSRTRVAPHDSHSPKSPKQSPSTKQGNRHGSNNGVALVSGGGEGESIPPKKALFSSNHLSTVDRGRKSLVTVSVITGGKLTESFPRPPPE